MVMFTNDTYEKEMYERIMAHSNCLRPLRYIKCSALRIVSHDDGENVAIECTKCKEVIIDFNRPEQESN